MPYLDTYWLILGPCLLLGFWASSRVKSTFNEYAEVGVSSGMTGAQAAAAVAPAGGAVVTVERSSGFLSDHYDPRTRTLRLSPEVYDGRSVSAVAVGAHEAGHALQEVTRYPWLGMRSALVPVVQFGSRFWAVPLFTGLVLQATSLGGLLMLAGIGLLSTTVLFQLVTLPVEFDASNRAKHVLAQAGIVRTDAERHGVDRVLGAAAMTYVAGAVSAVATLAYYASLLMGGRGRDR
ncbi:MAG: zinc metallopeptidase [Planctomycetota bacterium]|nr:zinc metallopeptidase [Planctomycetota bacterium]